MAEVRTDVSVVSGVNCCEVHSRFGPDGTPTNDVVDWTAVPLYLQTSLMPEPG